MTSVQLLPELRVSSHVAIYIILQQISAARQPARSFAARCDRQIRQQRAQTRTIDRSMGYGTPPPLLYIVDMTINSTVAKTRGQCGPDFCLAMLCISAARRAVFVCLSVCLSVTFVYSKQVKTFSNVLHRLVANSHRPTTVVFPHHDTLWQYSDRM